MTVGQMSFCLSLRTHNNADPLRKVSLIGWRQKVQYLGGIEPLVAISQIEISIDIVHIDWNLSQRMRTINNHLFRVKE